MRYGIFSDVHSNLEAFEAVIGAYRKEAIDKYLCVGDVVGYGADPQSCIERVKVLGALVVAGNHDWACIDLLSLDYFSPNAGSAILWTRANLRDNDRLFLRSLKLVYENQDLTLVHGALNNPREFAYMEDADAAEESFGLMRTRICFVGHTHVPASFIKDKNNRIYYHRQISFYLNQDNKYIVNVGSVGQPRDRNPYAAYCIYDTDRKEIQIKRVSYDIETARKKIIDAGLLRSLGDRLVIGK